MANLEELKAKVDTLAAKIVELKKANPVDKDAVGAAVKDLLDAKRTYAQNNNGIGVDGKEWQEPMSKAEKKKLEKAKKAAANADMVNGKQVRHIWRKPQNLIRECDDNHIKHSSSEEQSHPLLEDNYTIRTAI